MNTRIKELRRELNLTQPEFGEKLGVGASAVSLWESGNRAIPESAIRSICREFNVSELWLREGEGDMFVTLSREQELVSLIHGLMADNPKSLRVALITTLLRFDPDGPEWAILERIADAVSAERDKPDPPTPD